MLITGVCGSRAGVRASKSATDIPVCSTRFERLEEVVAPLVHVVAPLSPCHDTCHEARNRCAGHAPEGAEDALIAIMHWALMT